MQEAKEEFEDLIERFIALQFIFDKQWRAVKVSKLSMQTCSCRLTSMKVGGMHHVVVRCNPSIWARAERQQGWCTFQLCLISLTSLSGL